MVEYGNIIAFFSRNDIKYVFVQRYAYSEKQICNYVELPKELHNRINIFFPIVVLSQDFTIIPVSNIRHKCILVPIDDVFCISEIKIDYEHD